MKKHLILSIALIMISFAGITNVSAASINSQSKDVTVGEVDIAGPDDENSGIHAPNTGLFGIEASTASVMATTFFTVFIIAVIAYLVSRTHRKHIKQVKH